MRVQTLSAAHVDNPWLDATPRTTSAAPRSALVELSGRGAPELPSLALQGFVNGAKLRTPEGDCLTISQIDGGGATMVNSKGKSTHVALHVLADDFKVAAAEQQVILPIIAPSPLGSYELIAEQRRSKVRVASCSAFDITSVGATDLAIFNRPSKAALAGEGFTAGKLALVPLSPIVGIAAKGKVPSAAISVGDSFEHGGVSLQAFIQAKVEVPSELPSASGCSDKKPNPFVVPFWFVRSSDNQSHCNMEMGTIDIMLTTTSKAISIETLVRIPVMRNTHSVKAKDELVVYQEKAQASAPEDTITAKRARPVVAAKERPKAKAKDKA